MSEKISEKMSEKLVMVNKTPVVQKVFKLLPPDGGWGWLVVLGTAISNIFNQSMLSLFSLLYGDALENMGHKTQGAAVVLSTMLFVTNFGGPIAGVLLKLTSARFVAVTGACLCTAGIFLSGFSTNIWHLVMSYGVLLGAGLGFIQNSSFVAINSYFKLRKSRAVGLANVGTGVGQTVMPHLVSYLLGQYGFQGACLLLSGLSLHGIGGVLLIHPVAWHMKKVEEDIVVEEKVHLLENGKEIVINKNEKIVTDLKLNNLRRSTEPNLLVENGKDLNGKSYSEKDLFEAKPQQNGLNGFNKNGNIKTDPPKNNGLLKKLYDLFDISLLTSPRFLNVILGTALSVTSIQNFSMLFPLFLQKAADLNKHETAMCMSAVAFADILGRLILPTFQDKYHIKARWMLIITSFWIIVTRQILAYQSSFTILMLMSCLYGFGRSMIIVARNIAISENCKIEQVPAAVGLGMLAMGVIVPPTGYFLGWVRDYTDSYATCITAQNALLVLLLVMWVPDMLALMLEEKRQKKKDIEQAELQ